MGREQRDGGLINDKQGETEHYNENALSKVDGISSH
jgi:hypothetical protein